MKAQILLILFVVWFLFFRDDTVVQGAGVVAPDPPVQKNLTRHTPFSFKEHTIVPLATFEAEARVLSTERYRFDRGAVLSPVDLVLGWGRMSDETVLREIDIDQSGRWYHWRSQTMPIPRREIETHSANMHMIPENETVAKVLTRVRTGEILRLKGYLVEVQGTDGSRWVSSLLRTDTGAHACEVVFVRDAQIIDR